jgi:SDR family mycofactocin-dependent oxidoreductase
VTDQLPVAVVTGAGRGIGRAVAWRLVEEGWQVIAVDGAGTLGDLEDVLGYRLASAADLKASVRHAPAPARVHAVAADVRDAAAMAQVVEHAADRYGGLDAAVAAAGVIGGGGPLWETPVAVRTALLNVNVTGVGHLAAAAVPAMLRRPAPRSGRFVAVASAAADRGLWHLAAYCASKAACVGLIRGLAEDLRGSGITANAVSPGSTRTDMLARTAELYDLTGTDAFADRAPLERLLEPAEIAGMVGYLCSAAAAGITGAVLAVDGGLTT